MPRLEPGMIIKTNYGTGPYVIKQITRGCTCAHILSEINMANPACLPPHLHLTLTDLDGSGKFYLNYYDEETLLCLGPPCWDGSIDEIIILPRNSFPNRLPIQTTLF